MAWLNKTKAAAYCGIDRKTLNCWIARGLPMSQVGSCKRLNTNQIDDWLLRQQQREEIDLDKVLEGIL